MKHHRLVATSCTLLSLLLTVSFTSGLHAAQAAAPQDARAGKTATTTGVPRLIKFAGTLPENANAGVTRAGTVGIQFAVYGERTGGAPLWQETQNVQLDGQARYAVLLGAQRDLPAEMFSNNEARWLGVQVLADAEPEQARVLLVSVPYALKAQDAETLGGRPASAYVSQEALSEVLRIVPGVGTKGRLGDGRKAKSLDSGPVSTTVAHTNNAIPRFSSPDTLADSMMFELYNQPAADAFGFALPNEDVLRLGNRTGRPTSLQVDGRVVAEGFDLVTSAANSLHVVNMNTNGLALQANTEGTGFSTALFGSARSFNGSGLTAFSLPPAGGGTPDPLDYSVAVYSGNYNQQGVGVHAWSAYNGTPNGDDYPILTGPIGLYAAAAHSTGIAAVLDHRAAGGGTLLSGRNDGTEVITMTTAGDITAAGAVTANSFTGSGAGLTGVIAASATSFAANPADCAAGQYANAIDASGNLGCDTVDFSQLSGTSTVARTNVDNNFTTSQTVAGAVTANSITLPATADSNTGVITLAGVPFIHSKSIENFPDPMTENTFVGRNAGNFTLHGHNNTGIGSGALRSSSSSTGGIGNTAVGNIALRSTTTGISNTGIGYAAAWNNTTGSENTAIGGQALAYNTTGNQNAALGVYAAASNITGVRNTALGTFAFSGPAALDDNTAVGFYALSNPAGQRNTALGSLAAGDSLSWNAGSDNTFIGTSTGVGGSITVNNSTAIGANALVNISNAMVLGDSAVRVGIGTSSPAYKLDVAGTISSSTGGFRFPDGTTQTTAATGNLGSNPTDCTSGQYANAIDASGNLGCSAIQANQLPSLSGSYVDLTNAQTVGGVKTFTSAINGLAGLFTGPVNARDLHLPDTTLVGGSLSGFIRMGNYIVLHNGFANSGSIYLGADAGSFTETGPSPNGTVNTGVGAMALQFNTTGYVNTGVGSQALKRNTTGWGNTGVGGFAGGWNETGTLNTAAGWGALGYNTASENTAVGASALVYSDTGSKNTAVGVRASFYNDSGSNNTSIGYESGLTGVAGQNMQSNTAQFYGSNNTYLGYRAGPNLDNLDNATAIGANAVVGSSNAMVLGDSAVNVGIGTSSPGAKLHVATGDVAITAQSNGVILRATDGANCFRVTVNNAGALSTAAVACP